MKNTSIFVSGLFLIIILSFTACPDDPGPGTGSSTGESFVSQIISIQNDKSTLGLVGTAAASNKTDVATGVIDAGEIKITSKAEGYATITVSKGSVDTAGISVSVSKTGTINVAYISKYNGVNSGNLTATDEKKYNVLFGNFGHATDEEIEAGIIQNGWENSYIEADDGGYLKGSDANEMRTFCLNHPDFWLDGGADGTWDYLANEFTYKGVGLPDGDLKTQMTGDTANCPLAGMFRVQTGIYAGNLIVFYMSENRD